MKLIKRALAFTTVALLAACGSDSDDKNVSADTVYQNGYIYTSEGVRIQRPRTRRSPACHESGSTTGLRLPD